MKRTQLHFWRWNTRSMKQKPVDGGGNVDRCEYRDSLSHWSLRHVPEVTVIIAGSFLKFFQFEDRTAPYLKLPLITAQETLQSSKYDRTSQHAALKSRWMDNTPWTQNAACVFVSTRAVLCRLNLKKLVDGRTFFSRDEADANFARPRSPKMRQTYFYFTGATGKMGSKWTTCCGSVEIYWGLQSTLYAP